MDPAGRVVVPKAIRDRAQFESAPSAVALEKRGGRRVVAAATATPALSQDQVDAKIDAARVQAETPTGQP